MDTKDRLIVALDVPSVAAAAAMVEKLGQTKRRPRSDIPRRALGKTGVDVSILCFGGAHWGRMEDDTEAIRVLHEAIDAGITFLDNAWEYNNDVPVAANTAALLVA